MLSGICPSRSSIQVLLKSLEASNDIFELDLSQCLLQEIEIQLIIKAFADLGSINTLKLDQVKMTQDTCLLLSSILMENHTLHRLSLKYCQLGEINEAARSLFTALGKNDTLEYLDLSNNGLMSSMGTSLALCGLKTNLSLRIIDLSWNKLGDPFGQSLVDILKINKNLQKIKLEGNSISVGILTAIDTLLSHNVQLHLKQAEMVSKTSALNHQLGYTKDKMGQEIKQLKREYQDLENRETEQRESMLFELGRLGEELSQRNKEFGALMEKLSLTTRALQVAEEKVEHLEILDRQRNEHFKQLQDQCAAHDKSQRQVRF